MTDNSINSDLIRGHIDTIVLGMLQDCDKYGYEICKEVTDLSEGAYELKEPTLYSATRRMEKQGLVSSYWGDEVTGGGRRKYYTITKQGTAIYHQNLQEWNRALALIEKLLSRDAQTKEDRHE